MDATTSIATAGVASIFAGNNFDDIKSLPLPTSSFPTDDLTTLDTVASPGTSIEIGPGGVLGLSRVPV
jgi:hypothetical protein